MKLFLCLFLIPTLCFSQGKLYDTLPLVDGKVYYSRIVSMDSISKDQIFSRIKDFTVSMYASQKNVLQTEDKESGYIAYKAWAPLLNYYKTNGLAVKSELWHTLKFYIKDNKVKIVATDFETVSRDAISQYFENRNGIPTEHIAVENWDREAKTFTPKRQAKFYSSVKVKAAQMDLAVKTLLDMVAAGITNSKSEFDF